VLQERLNYISVLSIENDIIISLSYEEAINGYAAKNVETKVLSICVRKLIKKYCVNILVFLKFVVFASLIKFFIYSGFSL